MTKDQVKKKAIDLHKAGISVADISKQLGIGKSTVYLWMSNHVEELPVRARHSRQTIDAYCKRVHAGERQVDVCRAMGINQATGSAWYKNYKPDVVQTYTTAFKRNVIGSLQAGRSAYEVQKTFNISQTELSKWIEEFKDGKYDNSAPVIQNALKPLPTKVEQPAIQTMSVSALDSVLDVIKLLTAKGLSVDMAVEVSKSLAPNLK